MDTKSRIIVNNVSSLGSFLTQSSAKENSLEPRFSRLKDYQDYFLNTDFTESHKDTQR